MFINRTAQNIARNAPLAGELGSRLLVFHEPIARRTGTSERTIPMRSTLLVSTAALLAGIGLASAQGMQGGQSGAAPNAQSQGAQGGAAGQERQSPQSSPSQRGGQAQQKEPMQKDTTGQAQRDQGAPAKADQDDKAQPQRSGQGQRDQQSPAQAQS